MIGIKGNAPTMTQTTPPASGGFFQQMQNDFKAFGDKMSAPYNALPEDKKKRYQRFNELAMMPTRETQFSPVQFGGAGGGASLLALVEEMKKRGF